MVLTGRARALAPAFVAPDEQTWTMAGTDPALLGVQPVFHPAAVRRVLLPTHVPRGLAGPLSEYLQSLPGYAEALDVRLPLAGGVDARELEAAGEDADGHHGHAEHAHEGHEAHGGHDHGDMMAIVGEPSSDGLVMEPIEFRFGPVGTPLPAGLVADVKLDGDVVEEAEVQALLVAHGEVGDLLAPTAWDVLLTIEREIVTGGTPTPVDRWIRLAAVEVERALSHVAWLRAFGRVLGWSKLVERSTRAVSDVIAARRLASPAVEEAQRELDRLDGFVQRSRWLRHRTAGRAHIPLGRAHELGLRGPTGRASGLLDDARTDDPLYERLGFEPVVRTEADALARTLVRSREAVVALELAGRALEHATGEGLSDALPAAPASPVVEGPRGPLRAQHLAIGLRLDAPGEAAALSAAGETMVGAEWAAALVGLASFDLSPWRVGA